MTDVLVFGDTVRVPELRREIPISVPDPFLYVEAGGERHAVVHSMEASRIEAATDVVCHALDALGYDTLLRQGRGREDARDETIVRALGRLGVESAAVPAAFPLGLAERLRAAGIELRVDQDLFDGRRRVKTDVQLAGIRRAQRAAEAGMDAARDLLRRAGPADGTLVLDGGPLTSERVKAAIALVFAEHGCSGDDFIVSHGPQSAVGHDAGSGPLAPGEPIVIDLWPRDGATACFADMTRTFCVGEIPDWLADWHALAKESLDAALAEVRPGASCRAVYDASCEPFERAGHPTQRTKEPGVPLEDGFFHGLGHGVGLEVHEAPSFGIAAGAELVAGDVVTLEPGTYRRDRGGVRLEDLVLVTADGAENLTRYPYNLAP